VELSLEEKLREFESWITASIQDIGDTTTYREEQEKISRILSSLANATRGFESPSDCNPEQMAFYCVAEIERIISEAASVDGALKAATDLMDSLISMLFLVTGKSDNNIKCQFPVFLFQNENRTVFPVLKGRKGKIITFEYLELGRVVKQDRVSKLIAEALVMRERYEGDIDLGAEAVWLLKGYIKTILDSPDSVEQLWALGFSYFFLKNNKPGFESKLLAPIIAFKVRGSVAAQSGHIPERILRGYMKSWGLKADVDFNSDDVIVDGRELNRDDLIEAAVELHEGERGNRVFSDLNSDPTKTRAYDFVLPFKTSEWSPRVFIQAQFYAGDSGSVSHKVVDQTRSSRVLTRAKYPKAVFLEYLDGAGYYASLFGDLKHMLDMPSTADFIQVRTAHVKLRRVLQHIGFLTPLDFVHALFRTKNIVRNAFLLLLEEGYQESEINRCFVFCKAEGLLKEEVGRISISPRLVVSARRIMLLDIVVLEGDVSLRSKGEVVVFAPGVKSDYGVGIAALGRMYERYLDGIESGTTRFGLDLEWLSGKGFIQIKAF